MTCSNCGTGREHGERFCRKCGTDLERSLVSSVQGGVSQSKRDAEDLSSTRSKDPDELIGNGIGSVIMGDGFLMVAVILSATHTAISSLLWLLLLIPAFFFFGKGFADVLLARQLRKRSKQKYLDSITARIELSSTHGSVADVFNNRKSGELVRTPSVTERTTRQLK